MKHHIEAVQKKIFGITEKQAILLAIVKELPSLALNDFVESSTNILVEEEQ